MRFWVLVVAIFCAACSTARADDIFTLTTGPGYRYPYVDPGGTITWTLPPSPTPAASGDRFFYNGVYSTAAFFEVPSTLTAPNPIDFGTSDLNGQSFLTFTLGLNGEELSFVTSSSFYSGPVTAPTFLPGTYYGSGDILYGGLHDYAYPNMMLTIQSAATPEPSGLSLLCTVLASGCLVAGRKVFKPLNLKSFAKRTAV